MRRISEPRTAQGRAAPWVAALVGCAVLPAPSGAIEIGGPKHGATYTVAEGEAHEGDLYVGGASIRIAGTQDGDLFAFAQSVTIPGTLRGDLFALARSVDVSGRIGDSVRVLAQSFALTGEIDGDVVIFAESVNLAPGSRVTGDVLAYAARITSEGAIDGDLKAAGGSLLASGRTGGEISATCGEITLRGEAARADLKCDTLHVDPGARIAGDLVYKARQPADIASGVVGGEVVYLERRDEPSEARRQRSRVAGKMAWWLWSFVAAAVVGLLWLAVLPRSMPRIERAIEQETLSSLGLGFVILLVVPVGSILAMVLIVTIPLSLLALMLYLMALYLAKIPVAVWMGRRLLRAAGRSDPSPYLGLLGGLLVLYLAFLLPYLGFWLRLATILLGLGALSVALRRPAASPEPPAPA